MTKKNEHSTFNSWKLRTSNPELRTHNPKPITNPSPSYRKHLVIRCQEA
jgi:hypothetical protein